VRKVGGDGPTQPYTLAGPLCTSLDRLGSALLPELQPGDLLAFGMAGAYGFTEGMTNFLSHPLPPEVWVD
jgi:diaminopimelate decarboxylase